MAVLGLICRPPGARGDELGGGGSCGPPFRPGQVVAGVNLTIPNTNVSLRMPNGWRGALEQGPDGYPIYRVVAPQVGAAGVILLAHRRLTGADRNKSLGQFLSEGVMALAGTQQSTLTESSQFTFDRKCGGRAVVRTADAECSATILRADDWLYMVFAKYPFAVRGPVRAGIDTLVVTASLAHPSADGHDGGRKKAPSDCESKYRFYEDRMCYCHGVCGL